MCCSVLQRVQYLPPLHSLLLLLRQGAVCCSVLQRVAACCSVLQYVLVCFIELQCVAVCCSVSNISRLCTHSCFYGGISRNSPRFSKVSAIVKSHSQYQSDLTFENFRNSGISLNRPFRTNMPHSTTTTPTPTPTCHCSNGTAGSCSGLLRGYSALGR